LGSASVAVIEISNAETKQAEPLRLSNFCMCTAFFGAPKYKMVTASHRTWLEARSGVEGVCVLDLAGWRRGHSAALTRHETC